VEGRRRGLRASLDVGDEYREARIQLGLSQAEIGRAIGISRSLYSRIEGGQLPSLSVIRAVMIGRLLGLDVVVRAYPGGSPIRDRAHRERLDLVLALVSRPLSYRREVPLPKRLDGLPEQSAWDAMISGSGRRTGVEIEMRLRDAQAIERRIRLKMRDDPVDGLLLLLADTRTNRQAVSTGVSLLDLPRLTIGTITKALRAGLHPPSGVVFV